MTDVLTRLRAVDTTSLIDAAGPTLRVLPLALRPVGLACELVGTVVTADAGADLVSVIAALAECCPGDVLVIAAGGDDRAVAGELFGTEAVRRGVAGLIIDGRCRDSAQLARMELPVFARGVAPHAYPAQRAPRIQVPIVVGDVTISPGDLVRGDADGLVVGSAGAMAAALDGAEAVWDREVRLRAAIEQGRSLFDAMNADEHIAALRAGRPSQLAFRELT